MNEIKKLIYLTRCKDILANAGVPERYIAAIENVRWDMAEKLQMDGGEGSGNFGHLGDPPNVGGAGGGGAAEFCAVINGKSGAEVQKQYGLNKNAIIHAKQAICKSTGGSVKDITNAQALYFIQNAKSKQNPGGADKAQVIKELQDNPGSLQLNKPTPSNPAASTTAVQDAIPKDAQNKAEAQKEALEKIQENSKSTTSENKTGEASESKPEGNTTSESKAEQKKAVSELNSKSEKEIEKEYGLWDAEMENAKVDISEHLGIPKDQVTNEQALYYAQQANKLDVSNMTSAEIDDWTESTILDAHDNKGNLKIDPPKKAESSKASPEITESSPEKSVSNPSESGSTTSGGNASTVSNADLNSKTAASIQKEYGLNQNAIVHAKQAVAKELGLKTSDITNAEAMHYLQNVKGKQNPDGIPKADVIKNIQEAKANGSDLDVKPSGAAPTSEAASTPAQSTTATQPSASAGTAAASTAGEAEGTASEGPMEIPKSGPYLTEDGSTRWGYMDYKKDAKKQASYTKNIDESLSHYKDLTDKAEAASTYDQHKSTQAYTGSEYVEINEALNGLDSNFTSHTRKEIDDITAYIDNSVTDEAIWMRRGLGDGQNIGMFGFSFKGKSIEEISAAIVGKEYVNGSFMSARASKQKHGMTDNRQFIYDIHCPKGTRVAYVASFSNIKSEDEFIIQRGTTFKPTHVWKDKTGKIHVDLDVVEQIAPGAKLGKKYNENVYGKKTTTAWEKTSNGAKTSSAVKAEKHQGIAAKLLSGGTPSMSELLSYTGLKKGTSLEKLKEAAKKKAEANAKPLF